MEKTETNTLIAIGNLIYVVYSLIDRFIIRVPDIVAIPIMIIGIAMIIGGFVKMRKDYMGREV